MKTTALHFLGQFLKRSDSYCRRYGTFWLRQLVEHCNDTLTGPALELHVSLILYQETSVYVVLYRSLFGV